jgi:hypothetical protein
VDCSIEVGSTGHLFPFDPNDVAEMLVGWLDTVDDQNVLNVDEATFDAWYGIWKHFGVILLSFIPVIMNQWKYQSPVACTMVIGLVLTVSMLGYGTVPIAAHNVLISFLSLMSNSNSSSLIESVWTILVLMIPLFAMFIVDFAAQIAVLISVIIGYAAYIYFCFFRRKRSNDSSLLIMIAQLFVLMGELDFVRNEYFDHSLGGIALEAVLSAVIPASRNGLFVRSAFISASKVIRYLAPGQKAHFLFLGSTFLQLLMFAIFRASLGAFYLHVLRFKTDFKSITIGFWVYIADLFGPVRCIYRLTFKLERFTSRRVMYALLGILLSYYEYRGAKGFFLMKLIISFLDMAIIQSNYGKMTPYLELNVDFCQNAFPHSGAMPWA